MLPSLHELGCRHSESNEHKRQNFVSVLSIPCLRTYIESPLSATVNIHIRDKLKNRINWQKNVTIKQKPSMQIQTPYLIMLSFMNELLPSQFIQNTKSSEVVLQGWNFKYPSKFEGVFVINPPGDSFIHKIIFGYINYDIIISKRNQTGRRVNNFLPVTSIALNAFWRSPIPTGSRQ